jgi:Queuine tRNA-ribosyltransferase
MMVLSPVVPSLHDDRDTLAMGWDQTLIKIDEQGATFRSYVDGTIHNLTPERSVDIQRQLGADLIVGENVCEISIFIATELSKKMAGQLRNQTILLHSFGRVHSIQCRQELHRYSIHSHFLLTISVLTFSVSFSSSSSDFGHSVALTRDEYCSGVYEEESPMGHTQLERVCAHHRRVCDCASVCVLFVRDTSLSSAVLFLYSDSTISPP